MDEDKHESTSPKTAGQKAAETKGVIERVREAKVAAWTRKNGKNDALNPYSKQNYPTEIARHQSAMKIGPVRTGVTAIPTCQLTVCPHIGR
jgi:hypothetical protein